MSFLSGASFVIQFQRDIITRVAAQTNGDEKAKVVVDNLIALTESAWLAAQDAAKERNDGNHPK